MDEGLVGTIPVPRGWELPASIDDLELGNSKAEGPNQMYGPIPPGWELPPGGWGLRVLGGALSACLSSLQVVACWVPPGVAEARLLSSLLHGVPAALEVLYLSHLPLGGSLSADWKLPPKLGFMLLEVNCALGVARRSLCLRPSLLSPLPFERAADASRHIARTR